MLLKAEREEVEYPASCHVYAAVLCNVIYPVDMLWGEGWEFFLNSIPLERRKHRT